MPTYLKIYALTVMAMLLICAATGLWLVRRSWSPRYKLLVWLSCCVFVLESFLTYTMFHGISNRMVYFFWVPIETWLIGYIMTRRLKRRAFRGLHWYLLFSLPVVMPVCYWLQPSTNYINVYLMTYCLFCNLIMSCLVLADLVRDPAEIMLFREPIFWMAGGMLGYSSIFLIVFSLGPLLDKVGYPLFIPFSFAANLFMYAGFTACFIVYERKRSNSG